MLSSSMTFDQHVISIFGALTMGATLAVMEMRGGFDVTELSETITANGVTWATTAPSIARLAVQAGLLKVRHNHPSDECELTHGCLKSRTTDGEGDRRTWTSLSLVS